MAKARPSNRAIWTGAITFGLVTIPVKLYTAVREENVSFHMLHDQDHARLQRKMVCSADGVEVHPEHTVKGYEIGPDQYVVITQEEIESVQPKRSKAIEIEDFVEMKGIDPVYYNSPYYIVPQETGTKPYRLLVEAMEKSGRVGIARFVMRNREHLAALRPKNGALIMETMYFGNSVIDLEDLDEVPREIKVDERELKMAQQLIEQLSAKFQPNKYEDEYVKAVREMVERKAAGEEVVTAPEPQEAGGRTSNLMEALQASLSRARAAAGRDEPPVEKSPEAPRAGKSARGAKAREEKSDPEKSSRKPAAKSRARKGKE